MRISWISWDEWDRTNNTIGFGSFFTWNHSSPSVRSVVSTRNPGSPSGRHFNIFQPGKGSEQHVLSGPKLVVNIFGIEKHGLGISCVASLHCCHDARAVRLFFWQLKQQITSTSDSDVKFQFMEAWVTLGWIPDLVQFQRCLSNTCPTLRNGLHSKHPCRRVPEAREEGQEAYKQVASICFALG